VNEMKRFSKNTALVLLTTAVLWGGQVHAQQKDPIKGLVTKGLQCKKNNVNIGNLELDNKHCVDLRTKVKGVDVDGMTVSVSWKYLEKEKGVFNFDLIDKALSSANNKGKKVRLRVFTGEYAPEWLKLEAGQYVGKTKAGKPPVYFARFWNEAYWDSYDNMMKKLAARYDGSANNGSYLSEVAISSCAMETAETLLMPGTDEEGLKRREAMLEAGYTAKEHKRCIHRQLKAHEKHWKNTFSLLTIKPWVEVSEAGAVDKPNFTGKVVQLCQDKLGPLCRIGNTSIGLEDCFFDYVNNNSGFKQNILKTVVDSGNMPWGQSWVATKTLPQWSDKADGSNYPKWPYPVGCAETATHSQYLDYEFGGWTDVFGDVAKYVADNGLVSFELPVEWVDVVKGLSQTQLERLKEAQKTMKK